MRFQYFSQKPLINAHGDLFSKVRGLNFGLSFHLHHNLEHLSSRETGKSVHMCRLALIFTASQCDTVNSEIFMRVLFSRNFASAKFFEK